MFPLLYKTIAADISPDSLVYMGRLTGCISCKVTEEKNGDYICDAIISKKDELASLITYQLFLKVKPNPFHQPQFFEIYDLTSNEKSITIKAKHIKHNCYNNVITAVDVAPVSTTAENMWNIYVEQEDSTVFPNHFKFHCDILNEEYMSLGVNVVCDVGSVLGDGEGSFLDVYGGEYRYDNFDIYLLKSRGKDKGKRIRWGKNLSSQEQTISSAEICSHVVAAAKIYDISTDDYIYLTCEPFEIEGHASKTNKVLFLDASDWFGIKDEQVDSSKPDPGNNYAYCRNALRIYCSSYWHGESGRRNGQPTMNMTVDYRPDLEELEDVGLCDVIHVVVDDEETEISAQIIKTVYDSLLERWDGLELGDPKLKLSDFIK